MIRLEDIKAVEKDADTPEWRVVAGVTVSCSVEAGRYKLVKDGSKWMIEEKSLEARKNVLRYIYGDLLEPLEKVFALAENEEMNFMQEEELHDTIAHIRELLREVRE